MHAWTRTPGDQTTVPQPIQQHPLLSEVQQQAQQQQETVAPGPVEEHTYVITHVENVYFQRK